jgi:predicted methyltransferase MtxX (methanogen marker protein 4)
MPLSPDPEKAAKQKANLLDPSEAGKLGGRPKGSKNWSSVVQELLDDEALFNTLVENMERRPAWLKPTGTKTLMQAVTIAQAIKAMGGSHFSAEWLRKTGWGDKVDITSGGERIRLEPVVVSHIKPRNIQEGEIVEPKAPEEIDDANTQA